MAHPGIWAVEQPDHPAVVMAGSGEVLTYKELDARANRLAHLLRDQGLESGDTIALFMENQIRFMEVVWAALRSGLYITAVNSYLTADEVAYIVDNSDAKVVISSRAKRAVAAAVDPDRTPKVERWLMTDGATLGQWESYELAVDSYPASPLDDPSPGMYMLYSSGTTGRPKGIRRPFPTHHVDELDPRTENQMIPRYRYARDMVYLCPAPLYHAAPLAFSNVVHRVGGTLVVMERFDASTCLELIEHYGVTHSQFVPTMFVRMLKLDPNQRQRWDLSSLQIAIHAAAPCPIEAKKQMIDWWGPIIYEYYAGTEGNGVASITSAEWLERPGSVGKAQVGRIHIVDTDGNDLPPGEIGTVYFSGAGTYEYYRDPEKTAAARLSGGRTTLGDVGYLDEDGYLFLTDRLAHMIISGGVNIYPQEIEDVLVANQYVADVAVFGLPDPEMGEQVKAVVELANPALASDTLARELIEYCRDRLAHYKCPRSLDFVDELPRLPTGKLYKRLLKDRYLGQADTTIV